MKNLYQKLSKENRKKLVDFTKQYSTTGLMLTQSLKTLNTWSFLKLGEAVEIWFVFENSKAFDFNGFTQLFEKE
jgi:hypothetical protein